MLDYYRALSAYVKDDKHDRPGRPLVVINPGARTQEPYIELADIIVNFEGFYATYTAWQLPADAWERRYPAERFWHLAHTTPTEADMRNAVRLSKQRHAGWVYVTPDVMNNPWDTLPPDPYWRAELAAVAAL